MQPIVKRDKFDFIIIVRSYFALNTFVDSQKLFIEQLYNGGSSLDYARNVAKNFDKTEPDDPSSNSKHISSRRFMFQFPSRGLETEFPQ